MGRLTHTYNTTSRFEGLTRVGTNGIAAPVLPKRSADTSGEHVFYAKDGYGPTPWMDHTAPTARGRFWVGTAPHVAHDTITHSTLRSEPLEFQQRCPTEGEPAPVGEERGGAGVGCGGWKRGMPMWGLDGGQGVQGSAGMGGGRVDAANQLCRLQDTPVTGVACGHVRLMRNPQPGSLLPSFIPQTLAPRS